MVSPIFIAEVKTQSPYGYKSDHSWIELLKIADKYGDWISIHTNPLWGGSFEAISLAKKITNKPILAKGLHHTYNEMEQCYKNGADFCLVEGGFYPFSGYKNAGDILYEVSYELMDNTIKYIKQYNKSKLFFQKEKHLNNLKLVYNARDLKTGQLKENHKEKLEKHINLGVWICQASGIKSIKDVHPKVNAFIVGENLVEFCKTI